MAYVMTIAGATKTILSGWQRTAPANGQGTMRFSVLSTDGSYVPALDAETIFTDTGTSERMFGGQIISVRESGLGGVGLTPIVSEVWARDFNVLATRRYFTGETLAAGTLKSKLTSLAGPYIQFATLDPAQVDGPTLPAATYTGWKISDILDQFTTATGYVWEIDYHKMLRMFVPGTIAAPFDLAAGDGNAIGDVTVEPTRLHYANRVYVFGTGVFTMVEDGVEEALHGIWDLLVNAPDTTLQADVDQLAADILARSLVVVKTVTYQTFRSGLLPSRTQTINLPTRHINNTFMVTDIESRDVQARDGTKQVLHTVTAIEGTIYQTGWRDEIRQWGGASGGMTIGGGGGGGGGSAISRYVYDLGGSGLDFVKSPTPTWVSASPKQAQINTVLAGNTAVFKGRLRSPDGVSVQARVFDVTAATPCTGVSAVITNTAWQNVSFTVTLTPSTSNFYELQVLPGTADAYVGATGYIQQ